MNPTPTTDTQRLRELLAAATPGPWETEEHATGGVFRNILHPFDKPDERGFFGEHVVLQGMLEPDDAELIAALRNEAPALLDELERLRHQLKKPRSCDTDEINQLKAERDKLREEVERLTKERDAWKASHDNQVNLRRTLMDRPDLGDRTKRMQELISERDSLRRENEELKAKLR